MADKGYTKHDLSTPEGRSAWKQDSIVYTMLSGTYTMTGVSNGYNPYDVLCPTATVQSKETTEMMKRLMERQLKTNELVRKLFGGGWQ